VKAGWETKPLGELCDVIGGGTPSKDRPDYYGGNIPWATVRDMRADIITSTEHSITSEAVQASATNIIPAGNVVIATRVGLGKVCLLAQDTAVNQDLRGIVPKSNKEIDIAFLFAWFKSISEQIIAEGTGATVQGVKLPFIKGLSVPVPTMEEQRRIVTLLDEAFTDIATAKANVEKNLQNAGELFNSHLDAIVVHAQKNGEIVALSELATDITDGDHMPPPKVENGLPFITIGNIDKQTRTIDFSDTFKVPREYFDGLKANKKPIRGDVLYTVTGSFGIPVLVEDDAEFCFQRHIGLIRPKADVDSTWLHYLLQSPQVFNQAADGATGTAQKTVSLKVLRNLQVPRISPKDQLAHVETLRSVETECRRLESIYRQKLTALDDLKKSLLHQAFSGQL
jgi:type I restriction enzyme, S subunit